MNRQINPDHCAEIDGVSYMLVPVAGTPEWRVLKDGQPWRLFSSLIAARGWFDHVIAHPESDRKVVNGVWHCSLCGSANLVEERACYECAKEEVAS